MLLLEKIKASLAKPSLPLARRENRPLLDPLAIPPLIGTAPQDFAHYQFEGATLVTIRKKNMHGETVRRRGLVACMVLKDQSSEGASARIEMLVSLRDLKDGDHPDRQRAEHVLLDLHHAKLYPKPAPKATPARAIRLHEDFIEASREKLSFFMGAH